MAESFGIHALSQNWGYVSTFFGIRPSDRQSKHANILLSKQMTLSPVISSNVFNLFYGWVFDAHSIVEPDGSRDCTEGLSCYRAAYLVTICACALGVAVTLAVIWVQKQARLKETTKTRQED